MGFRMKIKVHIGRCICHAGIAVLSLLLYMFFHSFFTLIVFLSVVFLPVVSLIGAIVMDKYISVYMVYYRERVKADEDTEFKFVINNKSYWISLNCLLIGSIDNKFYSSKNDNAESKLSISVPISAHGKKSMTIPVASKYTGDMRFNISDIYYDDICGMITVHKSVQVCVDTIVYPQSEDIEREEYIGYMDGVSETEESVSKGNDISEVTDIREYQPGDRLKDIHWKLSAKVSELMVKERSLVSQSHILIVPDLSGDIEKVESVISLAYNLAKALNSTGTAISIFAWNEASYECNEYSVYDEESLIDGFGKLLAGYCYTEGVDLIGFMKKCNPFVQAFVIIHEKGGEIVGEIVYQ